MHYNRLAALVLLVNATVLWWHLDHGDRDQPQLAARMAPNLFELAHQACREFAAEAVFVVSNKAATWRVVHGMERLGIPAFGPIWDS